MESQSRGKLPVSGDVPLPDGDLDLVRPLLEGRGRGTVTCETPAALSTEPCRGRCSSVFATASQTVHTAEDTAP